jgi:hypothetical protein
MIASLSTFLPSISLWEVRKLPLSSSTTRRLRLCVIVANLSRYDWEDVSTEARSSGLLSSSMIVIRARELERLVASNSADSVVEDATGPTVIAERIALLLPHHPLLLPLLPRLHLRPHLPSMTFPSIRSVDARM